MSFCVFLSLSLKSFVLVVAFLVTGQWRVCSRFGLVGMKLEPNVRTFRLIMYRPTMLHHKSSPVKRESTGSCPHNFWSCVPLSQQSCTLSRVPVCAFHSIRSLRDQPSALIRLGGRVSASFQLSGRFHSPRQRRDSRSSPLKTSRFGHRITHLGLDLLVSQPAQPALAPVFTDRETVHDHTRLSRNSTQLLSSTSPCNCCDLIRVYLLRCFARDDESSTLRGILSTNNRDEGRLGCGLLSRPCFEGLYS